MKKILGLSIVLTILFYSLGCSGQDGSEMPLEGNDGGFEGHPFEWSEQGDYRGLRFEEIYYQREGQARYFSGMTIALISDVPGNGMPPLLQVSAAMEKILEAAEAAYVAAHRDGGRLGDGAALLEGLSESPDRFRDGRSNYVLIINASAEQIAEAVYSSEKFPQELIVASMRVSSVSFDLPRLPFAMNLGRNPPSLPEILTLSHLREGFYPLFSWIEKPKFPYNVPEVYLTELKAKYRTFMGGGTEIKAFMMRPGDGAEVRDWLPTMVQALENQRMVNASGYYLDVETGEILLQGDPRILKWNASEIGQMGLGAAREGIFGPYPPFGRYQFIFTQTHFAEVMQTTEEWLAYLRDGKARGLLKMYLRLGFSIETGSVIPHPTFPALTVIPLSISRERWIRAVLETTRRPGMSSVLAMIPHTRNFAQLARQIEARNRTASDSPSDVPPRIETFSGGLCLRLFLP